MTVRNPISIITEADRQLVAGSATTPGRDSSLKLIPLVAWMRALVGQVRSDHPDLTSRQMALLLVVYLVDEQQSVRHLASRLQVGKPIISRALDTLETMGYLRRQRGIEDRRDIFVARTLKGRTFLASFADLINDASLPEWQSTRAAAAA